MSCSIVHQKLINVIDNNDWNWTRRHCVHAVYAIGKAKTKQRTIRFVPFHSCFRCVREMHRSIERKLGYFCTTKIERDDAGWLHRRWKKKGERESNETIEQSFIIIIVSEYYLRAYRVRSIDESKCLCIGEIKCFGFGMRAADQIRWEQGKKNVIIIGCLLQFYFSDILFASELRLLLHVQSSMHHRRCSVRAPSPMSFTSCDRDRQVNQCQTWLVTVIDVMSFLTSVATATVTSVCRSSCRCRRCHGCCCKSYFVWHGMRYFLSD